MFLGLAAACYLASADRVRAAAFSGAARIEVADSTGGLSWNPAASAMIVQCWFKISIPSGTNLTDNMTILVNRLTGSQSDPHAYLVQFDITTGNIDFSARGTGYYTNTLIARPYLERWYHVAVVRQGEVFSGYTDGRLIFSSGGAVGNSAVQEGVSVGGWAASKYLFGEVQEVSIYQSVPPDAQAFIVQNMFSSQPTSDPSLNLKGYFPLAFSTNTADQLRNFAPSPLPTGTASATAVGPVTFEEANQAGEQSAFDTRKNGGRDALSPMSGGFSWAQTALARPTPGIAFDLRFGYSSANVSGTYSLVNFDPYASGAFGKGWRHSFESRVLPAQAFSPLGDTDTVGLMSWDGTLVTWDKNLTTDLYSPRDQEYHGEFTLTSTNCQWTTPERLVYVFRKPDSGPATMRGRLIAIRDFNNNGVQILWNETSGVITQVVDSVGGKYLFNYRAAGQITNVSFNEWQVNFAYDATNRLVSKTLTNTSSLYPTTNATTWQFQYDTNGLLARIVDPRANTNVLVQYDQYGRQTNQVDALGRAAATRYGVPGNRQITRIDSGTNSWLETYDRKGHVLAQQDPLTNITRFAYNTNGNRISTTEPLGWTTTLDYDNRANAIAKTNALGEVTRWAFHPFFNKAIQEINPLNWTNFYAYDNGGNLTNHSDDLGSLVRYTYATNGLVLTATDGNGNLSRFAYDTNGFLLTQTDPATNTTTFTRNDVGWKLAELDALGRRTAYTFDLNGNVVLTVDPIFREFSKTYDANGNLLTASDAKGNVTRFSYDAANQKTNLVDRTGTNLWQYTYTSRGKPERASNPLGFTTTNFYDTANRLVRASDPLGNTITNVFDPNGNLLTLIDPLGQKWSKSYDRLNRVISETDPQGDIRQKTFDPAGRVKTITSPNSFVTSHDYDGRGRLIHWRDAEKFDWLYAYDGNANITNITDALNGHYLMAYGSRNERTLERNQDNKQWQYTYDELLRIKTQTDPNGLVRSPIYDTAGRIQTVNFTSGRQDTYDYDENNNVKALTRRVTGVPTTTGFKYDLLDRVTQVTDPFFKTVNYGYDALSRITSLVYPDGKVLQQGYDPLNRLTSQVDWAGRQMTYVYDSTGRLVRRTYPNGVVQTNSFDTAGRITSLSYSDLNSQPATNNSIQIALTYAYDRNGNKTGGGERGTFAWPLPSLMDESSRVTASGRITNRVDALNATNNFTYQYDASGNMTNATGGGQSWALTYDEDNRTTSIFWRVLPMTDKLVTNRYDALGRRVSRTLDAVETRYVLDLQGSMERILCDTDAGGSITAWYVHGPDLCYKVNATNALTCFHADAQANIIALTDGNTNLVAQYAYTPFGRSLGSTNFSVFSFQPFSFVGSQGVMEELPGLHFMRARYYSSDAGVFLSTDPVKNIGPKWRPSAYLYTSGNPSTFIDPSGNSFVATLGGAVGATFAAGGGLQLGGSTGIAIEMPSGNTVGYACFSVAQTSGLDFGPDEGMEGGYYPNSTLDDLNGTSVYAGGSIGAGGKVSGDIIMDTSGKMAGGSVSFSFKQGGGASYHKGTVTCATIAGTEGNIFNPFIGPDHSFDANGGTVAGSTPMLASGISNTKKSSSIPAPSFNIGGAVLANKQASGLNQTSTKPNGASGGGTTSGGGGGPTSYTVKAGNTLGNIAYANHTTVSAIATASGIKNVNLIHPGQVVRIRP